MTVRALGPGELGDGAPAGVRMVSCFLVNRRPPNPGAPDPLMPPELTACNSVPRAIPEPVPNAIPL